MNYQVHLKHVDPQHMVSIRGRTTYSRLSTTIGEFLQEVWTHISRQGQVPSGPPFTRYHSIDNLEDLEIEAGLPVREPMTGSGRVTPGTLPGGEVASTDHFGRYEDLPRAGAALSEWAAANARQAAGPNWEYYWTDPSAETDPAKWRTEVIQPLRPKAK